MSSELKKLQKQWYCKLAKAGFEDIEDTDSKNEMLKRWDSLYFLSRYDAKSFEEHQRYYQRASQFLESNYFDTSFEKAIWALWTEGKTIKEIEKRLKSLEYRKIRTQARQLNKITEKLMNVTTDIRVDRTIASVKARANELKQPSKSRDVGTIIQKLEEQMLGRHRADKNS